MSRKSRLSTLRQRPSETNSDFLNRFFEDPLIIEYTGFPLEERRVSHFIINVLSDPNHRKNASIQYQHLKQSCTHSFDYWLSVPWGKFVGIYFVREKYLLVFQSPLLDHHLYCIFHFITFQDISCWISFFHQSLIQISFVLTKFFSAFLTCQDAIK